MLPLPRIAIGSPGCCLSLRISVTASPATSVVLFQAARFSVFEKTTFGSAFICFATTGNCCAAAGVGQFGSGWCWLQVKNGKLEISKTPNGENPLVHGAIPILGCDVWEHSYYIDYRNRRPDYLKAFVDHLVNWEYVDQLFAKAT